MKRTLISLITALLLMTTTSTISAQNRSARKVVKTTRTEYRSSTTANYRAQHDRRVRGKSNREEYTYSTDVKSSRGYIALGAGSILTQHQFTDPHIGWDWKNILTNFDLHIDAAWGSGLFRVDYHRFEFCGNNYNVIAPLMGARIGNDLELKALVGPAYDITGNQWLAKSQLELSGKIFKNTHLYLLVDANWDLGGEYFDNTVVRDIDRSHHHGSFDVITNISIGIVEKF